MKSKTNWKLFFLLLAVSIFCTFAVLPYAFTLASEILQQADVPFYIIIISSVIQSTILFAIALFFGLKLSKKFGLGLPIIESYIDKKKPPVKIKSILKISILLGVAIGIIIILLDLLFTKFGVGISLWTWQTPARWERFLASFYGGIWEEILLRLFFMTFLIWIFNLFKKSDKDILDNKFIMWSSIIIAAVIFGLGHLPITQSITNLTPLVITRAILLNGVGGIVFGWLYWKKGLESAIIAHFSTDIILQILFPLFLSMIV